MTNDELKNDSGRVYEYTHQSTKIPSHAIRQKINSSELNQEIKLIEKKIRQCQKRIDV